MYTSIVQGSQVCCVHSLLASSFAMAKKSMNKRRVGAANKKRAIAVARRMSTSADEAGMTELASHYGNVAQKHIAPKA